MSEGTSFSKWQINMDKGAYEMGINPRQADYYASKTTQPAISAPNAPLTFDQPAVSTYNPNTGYTPWSGTPTGPNVYSYQGATYPAAQQNFVPQQPSPMDFQPTPDVPAGPAAGGRTEYNSFNPQQQEAANNAWLGGDSDYTAQMGAYQRALEDFIGRITGQIQNYQTDAESAIGTNKQNELMSSNSLGEDFGSRGLINSGMFGTAQDRLGQRFAQGRTNIEKNRDTNVLAKRGEQADYTAENAIGQQNARRASLLNMANRQNLIDQGA